MTKRTRNFRRPFLLLLLVLCCSPRAAPAQEGGGNPANWCRNGLFAEDAAAQEFKLARATGGRRAYFYGDEEGCPAQTEKCRQKAYVVAGDVLIVSRSFGDFACAWYQPARGHETVGWIASSQLAVSEPDANPPPVRWLGEWGFYDNSLTVGRGRGATLSVSGEAFWHGADPSNVHTGEVTGSAAPAGNTLKIEDDPCKLTLRLVGDYLVAGDNGECGGMNVRFDGVYRRKKK
jgi:hypothetical protein